MADTIWLSITSYCSEFGMSFAILTNCTLLALLNRKQSGELGSYKYLMVTFCLFSLFYSSVEWFMQPLIHIYDDTTIVIQRKRFDYPWVVARSISSTYCGCFAASFTLFAVHFIYRYLAVCNEVVSNAYDLEINETAYVPYTFFLYKDNKRFLNPVNIIGLAQHVVIMSISFTIVFFCGYRTAKIMRKMKGVSGRTKELQKQLFNALVIQTIIPMIFMYIPTALLFLLPFVGLNIGAYGNMAIVSVHLYPGIDPLVIILLINDFRKTLSKAFCNALKWSTLI